MLRLSLLGPPAVTRDGAPVGFDTRKATALLAFLAVEGQPQPRDRLAALLWPEADATRARSALRRTLSVTAAAVDAVVVDRTLVGLDSGRFSCDVEEFRELVARADASGLRAAVSLYRDDFLAGFALRDSPEFEDWQGHVSEALRRDLGNALASLVEASIASGDLERATTDAQRWLSLDPLHEAAHHALIRLYAWRGQRSAAMRQYRTCVRVLDAELGVEPLEETRQLYDAVRRDALPPPNAAPVTPGRPTDIQPTPPPTRLVGRDAELAALRAALGHGSPTRGLVAAVSGPIGVGKTALLRAVEQLQPAAGAEPAVTTVAIRCHPEEASLAYGVAIELARGLLAAAPDAPDRLPRHARAELARLLPELAPLEGAANGGDDPAGAARLYAAVRDLVLAVGRTVTFVVDDAQWLDPASGELLAYLVRRVATTPLRLVLAWSSDDSLEPTAVVRAAADAVGDGNGVELRLRPLSAHDLAELVGDDVSTAATVDVERLLADTGGLPSLVVAALDAARRGEVPTADASSAVRDALIRRIGRLSQTGQQVLAAAAVLGARVDPELVRETSGRGAAETVAAVEEALHAGLLVELPGGDGYDVPFEALRRVVLESTTLARRRLLHHRAAQALIRRAGGGRLTPADAGAVAWHLQEAGNREQAAEWHWRAAAEARALHAHDEALEEVRAALLLGFPPAAGRLAEGEILIALGHYAEAIGALELAAAAVDPVGAGGARVERRLADVHHRLGDYAVADAHLAAALDALEQDDYVETAGVLAERALLAYRGGATDEAQEHASAALVAARLADDAEALASALNVLGVIAARRGEAEAAEELFRQSLAASGRDSADGTAIAALNNLARLLDQSGRAAEALRTAEEALARGSLLGDRHRVAALHTNLADLLRAAGDDERSMEHLKQAAALFADVDDDHQRRPEIWKLVEW